MNEEQFKILANKYAENSCNEEEKNRVEAFFNEMQNNKNADVLLLSDARGAKIFTSIKAKVVKTPKRSFLVQFMRVAAIVVMTLGIAYCIKQSFVPTEIIQIAKKGEKKEITLQDGSVVVLNTNSSISYPEEFGDTRNVKLTGEAYFKVKRNPKKPFIVTMHDMTLRVLGTSFNINSYAKRTTKVSVLTGIVALNTNSGQKVILTKNQQADFNVDSGFRVTNQESIEKIAWIQNTIVLTETTLAEAMNILENYHDVTVDFEDNELKTLIINGKFKEEKLENILTSIAFVKDLKIDYLTKNHVVIRRNKK